MEWVYLCCVPSFCRTESNVYLEQQWAGFRRRSALHFSSSNLPADAIRITASSVKERPTARPTPPALVPAEFRAALSSISRRRLEASSASKCRKPRLPQSVGSLVCKKPLCRPGGFAGVWLRLNSLIHFVSSCDPILCFGFDLLFVRWKMLGEREREE
ncbi:uncharacterized protein LOC125029919 [Penaeus chinensis]|uniref:uncharacterized protein LOC125029919 n=1 Tax=Penaeus chinensis TaxID=139456 RepID=UPI001FB6BD21|nr:uncharacterized protein LOC125029919 [Penaeus chinensis]